MTIRTLAILLVPGFTLTLAAEPQKPLPPAPAGVEIIENVEYGTGGGHALHADIARPLETPKDLMPAVLTIHGGGWAGGSHRGYLPFGLVKQGYFIAAIEYRLSGEAPWPAQIEDCKAAVRWLRANAAKYHVDPNRIGCMGHSAGGHLVACLGTLQDLPELEGKGGNEGVSSKVQAVVDEAGPTDFTPAAAPAVGELPKDHKDNPGLVKLLGGTYAEKNIAWETASPALHVAKGDPPFLVVHGELDHLVPIAQAERIVGALKKANVPVEFIRVKNGGHGLRADKPSDPPADPDSKALEQSILSFFNKNLKP
ncbi:MAG: alpha/beta hydrolase [Verrucomicrobiaceae bacterium]|nr:alpha/beta hydrolase [Verrucomicrobiaceae bacterium]